MINSVLRSKNIVNKTQIMILKPMVQNVQLQSADFWTICKHQTNKLQGTEMDFWRRSVEKSRKKKITDLKIRKIMNFQPINEAIEQKRLKWFGQFKRMRSKRIPKMTLKWMDRVRRNMNNKRLTAYTEDRQTIGGGGERNFFGIPTALHKSQLQK